MSDMEDYGFEYSDEDVEEQDVDIENQYYNSKGLVESDELQEALQGFQQVLKMETEQGEWGFKALKQVVKLHYRLGHTADMLAAYRDLLGYTRSAVTRNAAEKKINSVLDFVSQSTDAALLQEFYGLTLASLAEAKNDRLWFKTNMKLATLLLSLRELPKAAKVLRELHKSCQTEGGDDDARKGTQLLEVYAAEIQVQTELRNAKKLKELYQRALAVRSAIPHPRVMGIIRECGGKMHMHERNWADASTDFFEAFKSYDEAGSARRVACLKYLVLASMLLQSGVDPFDSQEARPYRNDPEVSAMTSLVEAYQSASVRSFERVLRAHRASILDDPFISPYVNDLLTNVRTQVVLKCVAPYTRVRLGFIAAELNVDEAEVQALLAGLILNGQLAGRIDEVQQLLELDQGASLEDERHAALSKWASTLSTLSASVAARLAV